MNEEIWDQGKWDLGQGVGRSIDMSESFHKVVLVRWWWFIYLFLMKDLGWVTLLGTVTPELFVYIIELVSRQQLLPNLLTLVTHCLIAMWCANAGLPSLPPHMPPNMREYFHTVVCCQSIFFSLSAQCLTSMLLSPSFRPNYS